MNAVIEAPWYRQFWPWFILSLLGSVVIASLFTLAIALHDPDGVVVGSVAGGGKKVLSTNNTLGSASVEVDPVAGLLLVKLADADNVDQLQLTLLHPTRVARDIPVELSRVSEREWVAELPSQTVSNPLTWQWQLVAGEGDRKAQGWVASRSLVEQ